MWTVDEINESSIFEAAHAFRACNASRSWIERMVAGRPFDDRRELYAEAERAWWSLKEEDWLEAFAAHPRLGESPAAAGELDDETSARWSRQEQGQLADSSPTAQKQLAAANQAYEERFGFVYLVDATGKGVDELLDLALRRLGSSREDELKVAAAEQAKITQRRLEKLLDQAR